MQMVIVVLLSAIAAQPWSVDLAGQWKFRVGDDPRWAPVFDQKNGYMDVTTAMAVNPGTVSFHWRGQTYTYPLCWLSENAECDTILLKIRHSFWRRPANHDYKPRTHEGPITEWISDFAASNGLDQIYFNPEKKQHSED